MVVGGDPGQTCADKVQNSTQNCQYRVQEDGGFKYYCNGSNLDQFCTAATTNTGNVCDTGNAVCGGNQWKWNSTIQEWVKDGECKVPTYVTARLQKGTCVPWGGN